MSFKTGDVVECVDCGGNKGLTNSKKYTVLDITDKHIYIFDDQGIRERYFTNRFKISKENTMFDSIKEYAKENRQIIITIGVVLLVDHLIFGGAFREKVKSLVDGLLNKAQKSLEEK